MPPERSRILLTGRPGTGKTTVLRRLAAQLADRGVPLAGFTTAEQRRDGHRTGFLVERLDGFGVQLADVGWATLPQVGHYGVDVAAFESVALPALADARQDAEVVLIDELGQMELLSKPFQDAVTELFDTCPRSLVATVHSRADPFTDALKARPDVRVWEVTPHNRGRLAPILLQTLGY